jgi:outer membrane murein-binding lipoprotein Lpp
MKQKLALFLAGIVLGGATIGVTGPVIAHHGSDVRKLNRSVDRLQARVQALRGKTQHIDPDGFYRSFIFGFQVLGSCPDQSNAIWEQTDVPDLMWLDDCSATKSQLRSAQRTLE